MHSAISKLTKHNISSSSHIIHLAASISIQKREWTFSLSPKKREDFFFFDPSNCLFFCSSLSISLTFGVFLLQHQSHCYTCHSMRIILSLKTALFHDYHLHHYLVFFIFFFFLSLFKCFMSTHFHGYFISHQKFVHPQRLRLF